MTNTMFVTPHLGGNGGTETVTRAVLDEYDKKRIEYLLVQVGGSKNYDWCVGLNYIKCKYHKSVVIRNIIYFNFLVNALFEHKPSVVICLDPILCLYLKIIKCLFFFKFELISWIHFSANAPNVRKSFIKYADYHLAISSKIVHQYKELGIKAKNIRLIYNPVKIPSNIVPQTSANDVPMFIYVGRIQFLGQKRLKDAFDALANLKTNFQFNIYGSGEDLDVCKAYCIKIGISKNVRFMGFIERPFNHITYPVTALLLTSCYEGFGLALTEAISNGIFVVSSDCEVGPSDIIDEINGKMFQVSDIKQLTRILSELCIKGVPTNQEEIRNSIIKFSEEVYFQKYFSAIDYFTKSSLP